MPLKNIKTKHNQGFTLIETFGAITILVISVLGPLSLLSANIADGSIIKNQMTANYLAQEGIELVIRERNQALIDESSNWLGAFQRCTESSPCNMDSADLGVIDCGRFNDNCRVYAETEDTTIAGGDDVEQISRYFAEDATDRKATIFQRSIYIVPDADDDVYRDVVVPIDPTIPEAGNQTYFSGSERAKIVVTVNWNFKGKEKGFVLSTYIYNFTAINAIES